MCRTCGSIIGAGQQQCAVCGTSISQSVHSGQRVTAEGEPMRFARSVLSRPYKFTIVLLVVNIFVFVMMWQTSGVPLSMTTPVPDLVLLAFGAKLNYLIQTQHQWWRFVTPMFIHVNLLHLIVNMYSLWIVGPYVEKLYGSAKFVVFWVLTGVAGVVASYLAVRPGVNVGPLTGFIFKPYDAPSAGASGALFGLVGVLFVFGIKFRHELPEGFKRAFGTGLLPMIFLNLFIGYVLRGFIDNSAHLGGLLSGALLALMVNYRRPGERAGVALTWRILQGLAIALVLVCFVMAIRNLNRPLPPQVTSRFAEPSVAQPTADAEVQNPEYLQYAIAINNAQEAFVVAMKDGNPSNIDNAVKGLESAPHLDQKSDELREQLKAILTRAKSAGAGADPSPGPTSDSQHDKLGTEFVAWRKDYNQWLKTNAKKYNGLNEIETK
jgi:membrane associated rhomboid family serine protease